MSGSEVRDTGGKPIQLNSWALPIGQLKDTTHLNYVPLEDKLHLQSTKDGLCRPRSCAGSLRNTTVPVGPIRTPAAIANEAKPFIDDYYRSIRKFGSQEHHARWREIADELNSKGTYDLKYSELTYGARTAYRNANRCIGRSHWRQLQVFDGRNVGTINGMFNKICEQLRYSTNKGKIRCAITIFPHRQKGRHDFRVWNSTLVSYACYKRPDGTLYGDPKNLELTEAATRLGWQGKGTHQDILPIIIQALDGKAKFFELPSDLLLEVPLSHPEYKWFSELELKWPALAGATSMKLDVGGLEFSAIPVTRWHMGSEIGSRALADPRYNFIEIVASSMQLDDSTNNSLWKDKAVVEINVAVLHSFQKNEVTIVDHHSAGESFMKHMQKECKIRGGCPGDKVWLVPPISGSMSPLFHQEMLAYSIKPMFDYQYHPWAVYDWSEHIRIESKPTKNHRFKEIARASLYSAKFTPKIKATILYASEGGRSLQFANQLARIISHDFDSQVVSMDAYNVYDLQYEQLVLIVASTYVNGGPPRNGQSFMNVLLEIEAKLETEEKLFSGTRFSVFAVGSSKYSRFCGFGKLVDFTLRKLGAERVNMLGYGDDSYGIEDSFEKWICSTLTASCHMFGTHRSLSTVEIVKQSIEEKAKKSTKEVVKQSVEETMEESIEKAMKKSIEKNIKEERNQSLLSVEDVRAVVPDGDKANHAESWSKIYSSKVRALKMVSSRSLAKNIRKMSFQIDRSISLEPGDTMCILPPNPQSHVNELRQKIKGQTDFSAPVKIEVREKICSEQETKYTWKPHPTLPVATPLELLTIYLDIVSPPTQRMLSQFAELAGKKADKEKLTLLATNVEEYEKWKNGAFRHLNRLLAQFPSIRVTFPMLAVILPSIQPRTYSIASSPRLTPGKVSLIVDTVNFSTQGKNDRWPKGVCSGYLEEVRRGEVVHAFLRSEPAFHLPTDKLLPIGMIGLGTGLATFRSFWEDRRKSKDAGERLGEAYLYVDLDTRNKLQSLLDEMKLGEVLVVKNLLDCEDSLYDLIVTNRGHLFVAGDCTAVDEVHSILRRVLARKGRYSLEQAEQLLATMELSKTYHEMITDCLSVQPTSELFDVPSGYFELDFSYKYPSIVNTLKRGEFEYAVPRSYLKIGLKVWNRHENQRWLTGEKVRPKLEESSSGEWPVAFHGTTLENAGRIIMNGFDLSESKRKMYGPGIYTSPDVAVAAGFSLENHYTVIIQSRVNPETMREELHGQFRRRYWISECAEDVRPYALLLREKRYKPRTDPKLQALIQTNTKLIRELIQKYSSHSPHVASQNQSTGPSGLNRSGRNFGRSRLALPLKDEYLERQEGIEEEVKLMKESWRQWSWPHLVKTLTEFSCLELLDELLPLMQPRLYSVLNSQSYSRTEGQNVHLDYRVVDNDLQRPTDVLQILAVV